MGGLSEFFNKNYGLEYGLTRVRISLLNYQINSLRNSVSKPATLLSVGSVLP